MLNIYPTTEFLPPVRRICDIRFQIQPFPLKRTDFLSPMKYEWMMIRNNLHVTPSATECFVFEAEYLIS